LYNILHTSHKEKANKLIPNLNCSQHNNELNLAMHKSVKFHQQNMENL